MLFSELFKIMVNKVTIVGFRGEITPFWICPYATGCRDFELVAHG